MGIKFSNFAASTIAVGLAPGDVTIALTGGTGARFPTLGVGDFFYAVLENSSLAREAVQVTARTGDTLTVVRAQEGTTALSWVADDSIAQRVTAGSFAAILDAAEVAGAAGAAAIYDTFDDRYLGAKAVAPTLDNDGNALLTGALYWNTATAVISTWSGSAWVAFPAANASGVINTPAGNIAAANVQAALNELDAEKLQHAQYTTAGTSAAYTLTPTPAITAYAAGQSFFASFALASGASPTMAISGVATPPNLVKQLADGTYANIAAGDIAINHRSRVTLISTTQALVERIRPMDTPAGTIIDFSGVSAPNGFLVCPTSLTNISRTTYAALFLAIGTTWGAGDGSTTFGLPWFAANYAAVQASGNVGTSSVGQVLSHSHTQNNYNLLSTRVGGGDGNFWDGIVGAQTSLAGGSANLAAGVRVLKCVKF